MNFWIVLAWVVTMGSVAGLAGALAWTWLGSRKRGSHGGREGAAADAGAGFSLARYQVMERLFSLQDLQFLSTQPGVTATTGARWKRDSLRIFRGYLRELTDDFRALHANARRMVAESRSESPEFAAKLVRQQTAFWRARIVLEWRLFLFKLGIGRVEVAPLLQMIEAMRVDLTRLIPEPAQAH